MQTIIGSCFTDPNSHKNPLFYLQYGKWAKTQNRHPRDLRVARLNLDGSKQIKGVNYWETYAPVTSWPTFRLLLTMAISQGWHTKQLDFILTFTQAPVEIDNLYCTCKFPEGFMSQALCQTMTTY